MESIQFNLITFRFSFNLFFKIFQLAMIRGHCARGRDTIYAGFSPLGEISWLTLARVFAVNPRVTQIKMDHIAISMLISQQMG